MVTLNPITSTILVIFFILASLLLLGLIGAVAFLVWKLNGILERYEEKIEPILEKADSVLTLIGEKTDSIGGKAELLLTQGEEMAENVHDKVDRTATVVQHTINAPIIRANSLAAALTEGLATFRRLQGRTAPGNGATIIRENTELTVEAENHNLQGGSRSHTEPLDDQFTERAAAPVAVSVPSVPAVERIQQETATVVVGRSS